MAASVITPLILPTTVFSVCTRLKVSAPDFSAQPLRQDLGRVVVILRRVDDRRPRGVAAPETVCQQLHHARSVARVVEPHAGQGGGQLVRAGDRRDQFAAVRRFGRIAQAHTLDHHPLDAVGIRDVDRVPPTGPAHGADQRRIDFRDHVPIEIPRAIRLVEKQAALWIGPKPKPTNVFPPRGT